MSEKQDDKIERELERNNATKEHDTGHTISQDAGKIAELSIEDLRAQLEKNQETIESYEKKLQYLLADFENLKKRTELEVQNRVNSVIDEIMLKFLSIYDDFVRAKEALTKQNVNTDGLSAILRNMDTFLLEHDVTSIDAVGEIFNPKFHEAISVQEDPNLDDNTITDEIRKGYILQNRVIRPSLVIISKNKQEGDRENNG